MATTTTTTGRRLLRGRGRGRGGAGPPFRSARDGRDSEIWSALPPGTGVLARESRERGKAGALAAASSRGAGSAVVLGKLWALLEGWAEHRTPLSLSNLANLLQRCAKEGVSLPMKGRVGEYLRGQFREATRVRQGALLAPSSSSPAAGGRGAIRVVSGALYGLRAVSECDREAKEEISASLCRAVQGTPLNAWTIRDLSAAFRGIGVLNESQTSPRLLGELVVRLVRCRDQLDGQGVGNILYGVRNFQDGPELRLLFQTLSSKIKESRQISLTPQEVGNSLYGLQGVAVVSDELESLLVSLDALMRASSKTLGSQEVGNAYYGLQKLSADKSPAVGRIFETLYSKATRVREPIQAQTISNTLYGIQNILANPPGVAADLIRFITSAIDECPEQFTAQAISNSLYALRRVSKEVLKNAGQDFEDSIENLLLSLAQRIDKSKSLNSDYTGQFVGNALYGLNNLPESPGTRAIFEALAPLLPKANAEVTPRALSNALYGLKNTKSSPSAARILQGLNSLARNVTMSLRPREISNALYGLRHLTGTQEGSEIMEILASKASEGLMGNFKAMEVSNAIYGLVRAGNHKFGATEEDRKSMHESRETLLGLLATELETLNRGATESMGVKELSSAIYGLHTSGDSPAIRMLLRPLAHQTKQLSLRGEVFDSQAVGNSLFGLRGVPMCEPLDQLLEFLVPLVENCDWDQGSELSQALANGLFGLQGLPLTTSTRRIIKAFTPKIREARKGTFNPQHIANMLFGLQAMTPTEGKAGESQEIDPDVGAILDAIAAHLPVEDDEGSRFGVLQLGQSLYGVLPHRSHKIYQELLSRVRNLEEINLASVEDLQSLDAAEIRNINQDLSGIEALMQALALENEIEKTVSPESRVDVLYKARVQDLSSMPRNTMEMSVREHLEDFMSFSPPKEPTSLQYNVYIDGFELDIYDPVSRLNIELVGYPYPRRKDVRRNKLRDAHLKLNKGVLTSRLVMSAYTSVEEIAKTAARFIRNERDRLEVEAVK